MRSHSVKILVIAPMPFECEFQRQPEDWVGLCEQAVLQVRGKDFESAKRNMEAALQAHLMFVLANGGGTMAA